MVSLNRSGAYPRQNTDMQLVFRYPAGSVYLKLAIAQVTTVNVIGHIPIPHVTQKPRSY